VLVDKLAVPVAPQQHAKVVEPRDNALELHSVHEKDRERDLVLPDVVEKRILEVLSSFCRHCFAPSFVIGPLSCATDLAVVSWLIVQPHGPTASPARG
jgi:hypothetical protein